MMVPILLTCLTLTPIEHGFIPTDDGLMLYYERYGAATDSLILVPLVAWNPEGFARWLGRQHGIVFYDPRNRGRSDAAPLERVGLERDLIDLETVRAFFGKPRVHLVGTSYYGAMVLHYAAKHPEHVGRIIAVGALSPRAVDFQGFDPEEKRRRVTPEEQAALEALGRKQGLESAAYCQAYWRLQNRKAVGRVDMARHFPDVCDLVNERPGIFLKWAGAVMGGLGDWDWSETMGRVKAPVLLLHGDQDLIVPPKSALSYKKLLSNAQLKILEGCGHVPWVGAPKQIFPPAVEFLK